MTAEFYRRWAQLEAAGVSPLYYEWANGLADDPAVLKLVESLPPRKRQPNLVFAAARAAGAPLAPYPELRSWVLGHWGEVREIALTRMTQTNEAARCAVLLPVLSRLPGPLALIEVWASAGLCLYPDRYSYSYETPQGTMVVDPPSGPSLVRIRCSIDVESVPESVPEVVWRAGIDLNPIDVRDQAEGDWLQTLVWPEHEDRRERLRAAASLVAADPPHLVTGDLLEGLPALVDEAPAEATLVVFHSAVLAYLEPSQRERFVDLVRTIEAVWVSNEGVRVGSSSRSTVPRWRGPCPMAKPSRRWSVDASRAPRRRRAPGSIAKGGSFSRIETRTGSGIPPYGTSSADTSNRPRTRPPQSPVRYSLALIRVPTSSPT